MYPRIPHPSSISYLKHSAINQTKAKASSQQFSQLNNSNITDAISSVFSSPSDDVSVQYDFRKPNEVNHITSHSPASEEIFGKCADFKIENKSMGSDSLRGEANDKKMSTFDLEYALLESALKKENQMEQNNGTISSITSDLYMYSPFEQSLTIEQMLIAPSRFSADVRLKKDEDHLYGNMNAINLDLQPQYQKFEDKRNYEKLKYEKIDSKDAPERELMEECDVSFSNDKQKACFQDVITNISREWENYNKDFCFTTNSTDYKQTDEIDFNVQPRQGGQMHTNFPNKGYTSEVTGNMVSTENMDNNRSFGRSRQSPTSDISVNNTNEVGIRSHPDLYENLSERIRQKVDELKRRINSMPRRKLRESLAQGLTIEDVEPLMILNRDELAEMLGLGVTTWKTFVHHTLGIPRWPARALKSQQVKERKLLEKKFEAESRGDYEQAEKADRDLAKLIKVHQRRRDIFRNDAKLRVASVRMKHKSR